MARTTLSTLMASSLILGASMAGCSGAALQTRVSTDAQDTLALAGRVEQALERKDFVRALAGAEALVAAKPREASFRVLLGRAYLANGRYSSAEMALQDAVALGNTAPRTIVTLALVRTGLGKAEAARDLLSEQIANLPAADYGLGMALAGDAQEGVRALLEAVQSPEATPTMRQNLAYALALSGDWVQARMVAGRDLDAAGVQERIVSWARTAQRGAEPQRVAALVGIAPSPHDSGMPAQLALNATPAGAAAQMADATPTNADRFAAYMPAADRNGSELPQPNATTAVYTAAIKSVPTPVAMAYRADVAAPAAMTPVVDGSAESPESLPLIAAPNTPMRRAMTASVTPRAIGRTPSVMASKLFNPVPIERASNWVVQIGAFDSRAIALQGLKRVGRSTPEVDQFGALYSTITLAGRTYHRLSLTGFSDRSVATTLCNRIRSSGSACFVRPNDGAQPVGFGTYWANQQKRKGQAVRIATAQQGKPRVLR